MHDVLFDTVAGRFMLFAVPVLAVHLFGKEIVLLCFALFLSAPFIFIGRVILYGFH